MAGRRDRHDLAPVDRRVCAEHRIAAAGGCGAVRLGEPTVATLRNAPIVTLSANGVPVTLVLDTGAEGTILTPAVAQRIGAQRPQIEFQRQLHGIAGTLQTTEAELRSFTIGGVAIPWHRVRVAPVNVAPVFSGPLDGVLGADSLSSFDVDLDLPGHRMVLYGKQTCPGAVPAWPNPTPRSARVDRSATTFSFRYNSTAAGPMHSSILARNSPCSRPGRRSLWASQERYWHAIVRPRCAVRRRSS